MRGFGELEAVIMDRLALGGDSPVDLALALLIDSG
jgi:hypothetical protein